jgi:hypothetical protein
MSRRYIADTFKCELVASVSKEGDLGSPAQAGNRQDSWLLGAGR